MNFEKLQQIVLKHFAAWFITSGISSVSYFFSNFMSISMRARFDRTLYLWNPTNFKFFFSATSMFSFLMPKIKIMKHFFEIPAIYTSKQKQQAL